MGELADPGSLFTKGTHTTDLSQFAG